MIESYINFKEYLARLKKDELIGLIDNYNKLCEIFKCKKIENYNKCKKERIFHPETQKLIEYYLNIIETDGINAFCKNVRRKGYVYADYIGETIN